MTEYTVHFQKGTRVGARSLRMVHVEANSAHEALSMARRQIAGPNYRGYRMTRIDHFDNGVLVRDC